MTEASVITRPGGRRRSTFTPRALWPLRPLRADERLGATERSQGSRVAIAGREHAGRVRELTKRYGEAPAVEGASFTLDPETITMFLGPNGAGKATTLRILLGFARPRAGEALLLRRPLRGA